MAEIPSMESLVMGRKPAGSSPEEPYTARLKRVVDARRGYRTYTEIAELAGMDKRVLSRILNGSVPNPRLLTVVAILNAVGADLRDLQEG